MVRRLQSLPRKAEERKLAINLREQGLTYSEILAKVPVVKSTLSEWLRDVGLSKRQSQRITDKKRAAMRKGWDARRQQRIDRTVEITKDARLTFKKFYREPLFILGLALYWAEGSKQKAWNVSQYVAFSNMDVHTHKVMLLWIEKYLERTRDSLIYEIYIHESGDIARAKKYWAAELKVPLAEIRVYIKKTVIKTVRYNTQNNYFGVLRINVPTSTDLNRTIAAWIECVIEYAL